MVAQVQRRVGMHFDKAAFRKERSVLAVRVPARQCQAVLKDPVLKELLLVVPRVKIVLADPDDASLRRVLL